MSKYVQGEKVDKVAIAEDICDGILTRSDVQSLLKNSTIRESFIGTTYDKKIDKSKWTRQYLDRLPNAAVAESFNEDYLDYLLDVSEYVNTKKTNGLIGLVKTNWWLLLIAVVAIVAIIVLVSTRSNS